MREDLFVSYKTPGLKAVCLAAGGIFIILYGKPAYAAAVYPVRRIKLSVFFLLLSSSACIQ
jgi:hypothetical protein